MIKVIEYYPDGTIKRIEFHEPRVAQPVIVPQWVPWPTYPSWPTSPYRWSGGPVEVIGVTYTIDTTANTVLLTG